MLKRLAIGILGCWIVAWIVEKAFGFPPTALTTFVLILFVLYDESRGLFEPAFTAIADLGYFLKRSAVFFGGFFLLRYLIWQVLGLGFLTSLGAWQAAHGARGMFDPATSDTARNMVMHELLASGCSFVVSYMFMNLHFPPRQRPVQTNQGAQREQH